MKFVAGGIGVGAKVAEGYRRVPTRFVTLQARPFMRLDPASARELATELLDAATRAEALPILRCDACGGLQPDHALKRCKGQWVEATQ